MQKGDTSEKEWYYTQPKDKEKMGPFSFREASRSVVMGVNMKHLLVNVVCVWLKMKLLHNSSLV